MNLDALLISRLINDVHKRGKGWHWHGADQLPPHDDDGKDLINCI